MSCQTSKSLMENQMASEKIAPSKSTVYVSSLPFSLTNNDLHKVFEKYGKIVKVTILRSKDTRKSRGVAFINFLRVEDAEECVKAVDNFEMFGRTLRASIAKDNGRSTEFIKKKKYVDKTRCYECGDIGHLSYKCPGNILGERSPPKKTFQHNKRQIHSSQENLQEDEIEIGVIELHDQSTYVKPKPKYKKSCYLSDEEELVD